jgi:hypothetical protein
MTSISGVNAGSMKGLRRALVQWVSLQGRLAQDLGPNDAPWWYNERASVSTFAAAVWMTGGIALEEYMTSKKSLDTHPKRSPKRNPLASGRGDIYFRVGAIEYRGEAKQTWAKLRGYNQESVFRRHLSLAVNDAKRRPSDGAKRVGILFLVPNIPAAFMDQVDDYIDRWVNTLRSMRTVATAWSFPACARRLRLEEEQKIYPGVAMLIKGANRH